MGNDYGFDSVGRVSYLLPSLAQKTYTCHFTLTVVYFITNLK